MKKCPKCNDFALYDDNVITCPICDTNLVTYVRGGSVNTASSGQTSNNNTTSTNTAGSQPIRPNNRSQNSNTSQTGVPPFETKDGLHYQYRGIVTETHPNSRLHSRMKKWINSLFRFEPYQFGHTSHETILRLEEFHPGRVAGQRRDFIFYGDVEGRFNIGDDVTLTAKKRGDRYIVTSMYSNETQSYVKPRPQLPAAVIMIITAFLAIVALVIISALIGFVTSGALFALLREIIAVIITLAILWWIIRSFFRRR